MVRTSFRRLARRALLGAWGGLLAAGASLPARAQAVTEWVSTSATASWVRQPVPALGKAKGAADVVVELQQPQQTIEGFGACFNELGWTALRMLPEGDRARILRELFAPGVGANFTVCRLPIGANDFARDWYSYDETPGDFALASFSVARDEQALIPFVQEALQQQPKLQLWASPWSPPSWMKTNQHYAAAAVSDAQRQAFPTLADNGLAPDRQGREGHDLFIQEAQYYDAYARYFAKYITAYRQHGIRVGMVMPQNEFNSAQVFPSCPWTAAGLARFVGGYLGPRMQALGTSVYFGTVERANEALVDSVLQDPASKPYLKGVGLQWAGKGAIAGIHRRYPALTLYQTEQECGDGKNDWKYCAYTWDLMRQYLGNGASAYQYWNIALKQGGLSRWGWAQNSLVTVNEAAHTYRYTYEYYLLKHLSHYVQPGAKRLATSGQFTNLLAFQNPDKSVVLLVRNDQPTPEVVRLQVGPRLLLPALPADSFNTLILR